MLSTVVTQRIRLYSVTWVTFEGNLGMLSSASHIFIHMLILYGPTPSGHTCLLNEASKSETVSAERPAELNCLYFVCEL